MTTATGKRVRADIQGGDAREVVNTVLAYQQTGEDHYRGAMFGAAHRALENAGYNGWTNYETWAMALWIDNDSSTYELTRDMARDCLEEHKNRTGYGATAEGSLAHVLKEWMEDQRPEEVAGASVWTDLLSAAFGAVDWYEIASNYIEEVQDEQ